MNEFDEYHISRDGSLFKSKLYRYIEDAKFNFIEMNTPNVGETIISGIAGNFPLPIPFNPISIASSIKQINKEIHLKDDFGWLFFIPKTRKKNNQN